MTIDERPAAPASDFGWAAHGTVDWTPRTYECAAALFGAIVMVLLRGTPLPLSASLAWDLAEKGAITVGAVYAMACGVVAGGVLLDGVRNGTAGLGSRGVSCRCSCRTLRSTSSC